MHEWAWTHSCYKLRTQVWLVSGKISSSEQCLQSGCSAPSPVLGAGTSRNQAGHCFRQGTWKSCSWWLVWGYCSVAAVKDTALGSIDAGGRKLGFNPALPLDSCVIWAKSLPSPDLSFPCCPARWVSVSGLWKVVLRVTAPTPHAGQRRPFAVTLGPGGKVHLWHVPPPPFHLLFLMPRPLDVPSSAFCLPNVLIAQFVSHTDTWGGPSTVPTFRPPSLALGGVVDTQVNESFLGSVTVGTTLRGSAVSKPSSLLPPPILLDLGGRKTRVWTSAPVAS